MFLSDLSIHVTRHAAALPGCPAPNGDGDTVCLSINSGQLQSRGTQCKEARVNVAGSQKSSIHAASAEIEVFILAARLIITKDNPPVSPGLDWH